jgi:hypothetical protein
MIQELTFSVPVDVAPILQYTMVATPIVSSPVAAINEVELPIFQEPIVTLEEEQQQHHIQNVPHDEPLRRSQMVSYSNDNKVYVSEEIQMKGDPTSFKEAMRSAYSSKWLEIMEDEMRSMSTNKVCDLEENPKKAKTTGCKRDPKGNIKRYKAWLVLKASRKGKG